MSDPVFQDSDMWYFWDETWADSLGPFETESKARQTLKEYGEWLTSGILPEKKI